MEKTIDKIEIFEGTGLYEEGEVYKCPKCGEVLLDSEQIDSFQRKANIFKIRRKLNVIGNSITMQVPKSLQEYYQFNNNIEVKLIPNQRKNYL
ncbi:MAG: hypothetical protein ACE5J9_02100 [Methanosarcinales archaeon]